LSYNVPMKDRTPAVHLGWRLAIWFVLITSLLLTLFEFVPIFVALRAGIAGLSIAVFGPLVLLAGVCAFVMWEKGAKRLTLLSTFAATIALIALCAPVVSLLSVANRENAPIRFNPVRYISFTGDSIAPARDYVYKEVNGQQLHFALYSDDLTIQRPAVLLIHGGGWQYGNYLRTNNWPKLLRDAGYQVISLEYRLASPGAPTWDKAPVDIKDAVAHIKKYAPRLGIQSDRIALLGQSAGGHLALLEANSSQNVRAVVGLYAPTDLKTDYELSIDKDSELAFLGGTPTEQPDRYKAVSVQLSIDANSPSTLLIQGTNDDMVDKTSGKRLSHLLDHFEVDNRLILLPYTGHSFDNQVGGFATQIAEQATLEFLASQLR